MADDLISNYALGGSNWTTVGLKRASILIIQVVFESF